MATNLLSTWNRSRAASQKSARRTSPKRSNRRAFFEPLEDRSLLATINVSPVGAPTPANNDYTVLAAAVAAAAPGDTIMLAGTFNWTETNAAASWAAGNDASAGTGDDYSLSVPANKNNLTITAAAPGAATIQGPGDLAGANLEGVFVFRGGDNKGTVISNLRILDFDLAIGFFHGAGGPDAFANSQILNNYIRVATDLNHTVAPVDVSQNIGIHHSYGVNQTVSGNTIDIPGNGISDSANSRFATSVAYQSTTGGSTRNNLNISNNTVRVLNAQSADPERIRGIWDNAHEHFANVTVAGNQFINLAAGNNPALNRQQAFWISSHSNSTLLTTVSYTGNTVSGANVGFKWLGDPEFPGQDFSPYAPVIVTGNTLTNVGTGFLLQSNGEATFTNNTITGGGTGYDLADGIASISGGAVTGLTTGVRVGDTTLSGLSSVNFDGAVDNGTDLRIDSVAGTVTLGSNNQFAGDTYYIDNRSSQAFTLVGNGTTLDQVNNFRIEDRLYHALDDAASGLVRHVAGNLYVTTPGTGASDESIQRAIDAGSANEIVNVEAGTFVEEVEVNKSGVKLLGAGPGTSTIVGPIVVGGDNATVRIAASDVELAGFMITRQGNNVADWNNVNRKTAGVAIQHQTSAGSLIHDNLITGNQTGIDVNNSNGHTIRNNVITNNHTGLIFRNQTDNLLVTENEITNNRTVGVLFLDASSGTNVPLQQALNSTFFNNNISGNWYGQIVDRQAGGSLPAPGTTNIKNFNGNWLGTASPVTTTANSAEPPYSVLIPVAYGGTATPPGGQPDVAGAASANIDITNSLGSGVDTNVETTPGRGTYGFQGDFSNLAIIGNDILIELLAGGDIRYTVDANPPVTLVNPTGFTFTGLGGADDDMTLDVSAATGPVIVSTEDGSAETASHVDVNFSNIDNIDLIDGVLTEVELDDIYVRGTAGADVIQTMVGYTQARPDRLRVRVNSAINYYHLPDGGRFIAYGRGGNDTMTHSAQILNSVHLYGEDGNDYIVGGNLADYLAGGAGADNINAGAGANVVYGDAAPAVLNGAPVENVDDGGDTIYGGADNDVLYGQGGIDRIYAGAGNDYLNGGTGNDTLNGDAGDDRIYGGDGNDSVNGGVGNDVLSGNAGTDTINGGSGNDILFGGADIDTLMGSDGNDLIVGGNVSNQTSVSANDANDIALTNLMLLWGPAGANRTGLGVITEDNVVDKIYSGTGNDDIADSFFTVKDTIYDFVMGTDEKF